MSTGDRVFLADLEVILKTADAGVLAAYEYDRAQMQAYTELVKAAASVLDWQYRYRLEQRLRALPQPQQRRLR